MGGTGSSIPNMGGTVVPSQTWGGKGGTTVPPT